MTSVTRVFFPTNKITKYKTTDRDIEIAVSTKMLKSNKPITLHKTKMHTQPNPTEITELLIFS